MDEERDTVVFSPEHIWSHKVLRVNYMTHDLRRDQDSINPRTHANIMVLAHEDDVDGEAWHPYWYGRVLGIYHVVVQHIGESSVCSEVRQIDFLFVHWFGRDNSSASGWAAKRLPRIGFLSADDESAFGFLDPQDVLRGVHLIPAFSQTAGNTDMVEDATFTELYYVNM